MSSSLLLHYPNIVQRGIAFPVAPGIILFPAVDAAAYVGVDVSGEIITVLDEVMDDRRAVDLMDLVMQRLFREHPTLVFPRG